MESLHLPDWIQGLMFSFWHSSSASFSCAGPEVSSLNNNKFNNQYNNLLKTNIKY